MRAAIILFVLFLVLPLWPVLAQQEANFWYFGEFAGLNFRNGFPIAQQDGLIDQLGGCASISDAKGNLLFYTNGDNVYNRYHDLMPNGSGLQATSHSDQSVTIVPMPGSSTKYYIFVANVGPYAQRLLYSIVDLTRDGGRGDITTKNWWLTNPVQDKVVAVKHCNGHDYWILTHERTTNEWISFLLSSSGINPVEVRSPVGLGPGALSGFVKASPDGRTLAITTPGRNIEVASFDNRTGRVTNAFTLTESAYSLEFSPDGQKLYTSGSQLRQYDVSNGLSSTSQPLLIAAGQGADSFGALQLGPDGKIYVATPGAQSVGIIHSPNNTGRGARFVAAGVSLAAKKCRLGLPNFPACFGGRFTYLNNCKNGNVAFSLRHPDAPDSVRWTFDDPASGTLNVSRSRAPFHTYRSFGRYRVQLITYRNAVPDTTAQMVHVLFGQNYSIGRDTTLCPGESVALHAVVPGATLQWQNGASTPDFTVTSPGIYWVRATIDCCVMYDTVRVRYNIIPDLDLGPDTTLCPGRTLRLQPEPSPAGTYAYVWQDQTVAPSYLVSRPGIYRVSVSNRCGSSTDSVAVTFREANRRLFGHDTTLCTGQTLLLNVFEPGASYLWNNGSLQPEVLVSRSGIYAVKVFNGCTSTDTIIIRFRSCPEPPPTPPVPEAFFIPNIITPNGDAHNDRFHITGLQQENWELQIFNQWGTRVFYTSAYHNNWAAADVPDGIYYYSLSAPGRDSYKGWLQVLRHPAAE